MRALPLLGLLLAGACAKSAGDSACGITALAGATMLLDQFSVPRQAITVPPMGAPEVIPVRVAAGPAYRGLVSAADSSWTVTIEGTLPDGTVPGFGVLVVADDGLARGVVLYTGPKVQGAPGIGTVVSGALTIPLLGLRTDIGGLEAPGCPFFPDSLARP